MALTDNLVGYWKFEETGSTITNSVTSISSAASSGTITKTYTGVQSNAWQFQSGSSIVLSTNETIATGGGSKSIAFWIKLIIGDSTPACYLVSRDNSNFSILLNYGTTNAVSYWFNGGDYTQYKVSVPRDDAWHFVGFSHDSSTSYVDAYLDSTNVWHKAGSAPSHPSTLALGPCGGIDELGIWTRALSSTEMLDLYNSGSGRTHPFYTSSIAGTVKDVDGNFAAREVCIYRETTDALEGKVTSNGTTGAFSLPVFSGYTYRVVASGEPDRNDLIYAGVQPA